jgi:excisionase family DNA binding protein
VVTNCDHVKNLKFSPSYRSPSMTPSLQQRDSILSRRLPSATGKLRQPAAYFWHLSETIRSYEMVLETPVGFTGFLGGVTMARLGTLEGGQSETQGHPLTPASPLPLPASERQHQMSRMADGIEVLLTSKEASQILKIHPKVLERMAKRGEVPALKVGKFWRYRATTLDTWINSRLQSGRQPCRIETSF